MIIYHLLERHLLERRLLESHLLQFSFVTNFILLEKLILSL
jgi:hypothetical protein